MPLSTVAAAILPSAAAATSSSLEDLIDHVAPQDDVIPVSDTKPPPGRKFWSHLWTAFHLRGTEPGDTGPMSSPSMYGELYSTHGAGASSILESQRSIATTSRHHAQSTWLPILVPPRVWFANLWRGKGALQVHTAVPSQASFTLEGETLEVGRSRSSLLSSVSGLLTAPNVPGLPPTVSGLLTPPDKVSLDSPGSRPSGTDGTSPDAPPGGRIAQLVARININARTTSRLSELATHGSCPAGKAVAGVGGGLEDGPHPSEPLPAVSGELLSELGIGRGM